jgi:Uma2 family endonuclease
MRWTNAEANVSTEPDGLFYLWTSLQSGRLRFVKGSEGGIIDFEGTPDMTLEIVSATSVSKDTLRLRDLYWRAGVTEYWLVDVRGGALRFEILRHQTNGYENVTAQDGWLASSVFEREFRLTRQSDPMGNPMYKLEMRQAGQG